MINPFNKTFNDFNLILNHYMKKIRTFYNDNYTDEDFSRLGEVPPTRKQVLEDYKSGMVVLGYMYTYNISSKKIDIVKNLFYND